MSWPDAFAFVGALFGVAAIVWGGALMAKWLIDDGYPYLDCCGCCDDDYGDDDDSL